LFETGSYSYMLISNNSAWKYLSIKVMRAWTNTLQRQRLCVQLCEDDSYNTVLVSIRNSIIMYDLYILNFYHL